MPKWNCKVTYRNKAVADTKEDALAVASEELDRYLRKRGPRASAFKWVCKKVK